MRILLVEDMGSMANTLVQDLEAEGHRVDLGFSISRAKGYLSARKSEGGYECLIIDLNMPTTGLTDKQAAQTYGGLLTGWVWLRDHIFNDSDKEPKDKSPLRRRTIIFSAYLTELKEKMPNADLSGVQLVAKGKVGIAETGRRRKVDNLLDPVRCIELRG